MCLVAAMFGRFEDEANEERAVSLLTKACELKEPAACLMLGNDKIAKGSDEDGAKLLKQACQTNYTNGCLDVARYLKGAHKDQEAITLIKDKCKEGMSVACSIAAATLAANNGASDEIDRLYMLGCEQGDPDGCHDLGIRYNNAKKTPLAKTYFKMGCDADQADACFELGKVEQNLGNKKETYRLFKLACDKRSANGCLSEALEKINKKQNLKDAIPLFRQAHEILNEACSDGYNASCEQLKSLAQIEQKFGIPAE